MLSPGPFDEALRARARAHLARFERRAVALDGQRAAAVALAMLPDAHGCPCFLITRRTPTLRAHAGQWALPGGRIEPGETPESAVIREVKEEIGLRLPEDSVLGVLDDYPTRSGYLITPVVVWVDAVDELVANPAEVAAVYRVPLSELDRPEVPRLVSIPESERPVIQLPLMGSMIHAPTAALLYQMREVVMHGRATRVHDFEQPVWAWR